MAFSTRAQSTFYDIRYDTEVKVEVQEDGFSGTVQDFTLAGSPLNKRLGPDGDKYKTIKGTEITLDIIVTPTDDYTWFYTNNDRQLKVVVTVASDLYWSGYVLTDQYLEYQSPVRVLSITASDQIRLLNTYAFQFGSPAVSPTGRETAIAIIAKILGKTGLDLSIRSAMNLHETSMSYAANDDPFAQMSFNQDLWINEDLTAANCEKVLDDILKPFLCRIVQGDGVWWIQRIPEMTGTSIKYREFDASGAYVSNSTFNPRVTSFTQLAGGQLELSSGWKQRTLTVDYGLKPSLIPSFNLPDSAFTADNPAAITGWTNSAGWWRRFSPGKGNLLVADTDGKYLDDVDYDLSGAGSLYLVLPTFTVTTVDAFEFSIDCGRSIGALLAPRCRIEVLVFIGGDDTDPLNYYSYEESPGMNQYTWINGLGGELKDINFGKVQSFNDLVTQKTTIPPPPYAGDMIIRISAPYRAALSTTDSYVYISNIVLQSKLDPETERISSETFLDTITSTTNFIPDDETINITDGLNDDALIPFYKGIITVPGGGAQAWNYTFAFASLPLNPLASSLANNCIMDSWSQQFASPNRKYTGAFICQMDSHQVLYRDGIVYLQNDTSTDLKQSMINGSFIELKAETFRSGSVDLQLLNRGTADKGILITSGLITQPGGEDGQLQFKSGGDFDGTVNVTWDGTRILKGGTLPLIEYHCDVFTVSAGTTTCTWPEPFVVGDDYGIIPIWATSTSGNQISLTPFNQDENGFDVTTNEDCTFLAAGFVKR